MSFNIMNKDIDGYVKDNLQQWQLLPHRCGRCRTPDLPRAVGSGEDRQPQAAAALLRHLPSHALQGLELSMGHREISKCPEKGFSLLNRLAV